MPSRFARRFSEVRRLPIPLPSSLLTSLSGVPIVLLLVGLLGLRWSLRRSAAVAFLVAVVFAVALFGMSPDGLVIAMVKGELLALFVLFVVWSALLLYNLVDRLGAVQSIGAAMVNATSLPAVRSLMIAWGFSGFLQGFAGFGAPVASVVPLLKTAGFQPVPSVAAAMVGHSWAITFGSMGSSYLAILLVTRLPSEAVAPWIVLLFAAPIILTGVSVLHILLGWQGVRRGVPMAAVTGGAMCALMWLLASHDLAPIASTLPAMLGCGLLWVLGRRHPVEHAAVSGRLPFHLAFLPYYLLILFTLASQFGPLASPAKAITLGIDLPSTTTSLGYTAPAEAHFPQLRVFTHPATVIAFAVLGMAIVYRGAGQWSPGSLSRALLFTARRSRGISIAVSLMVMMALVMADSGMTRMLAEGIRHAAGPAFPLVSPFLGVIGSFMTGSNTNSNVTMGALQVETAAALGLTPALIAASQTVGGSLGAGVSPDKVALGSAVAGVPNQQGDIYVRALPYTVIVVSVLAVEVLVLSLLAR
jgi:lactate permease